MDDYYGSISCHYHCNVNNNKESDNNEPNNSEHLIREINEESNNSSSSSKNGRSDEDMQSDNSSESYSEQKPSPINSKLNQSNIHSEQNEKEIINLEENEIQQQIRDGVRPIAIENNDKEIPQNKTLSKKGTTSSKNNSLNQFNIIHSSQNGSSAS